jgi:hypothetical protein
LSFISNAPEIEDITENSSNVNMFDSLFKRLLPLYNIEMIKHVKVKFSYQWPLSHFISAQLFDVISLISSRLVEILHLNRLTTVIWQHLQEKPSSNKSIKKGINKLEKNLNSGRGNKSHSDSIHDVDIRKSKAQFQLDERMMRYSLLLVQKFIQSYSTYSWYVLHKYRKELDTKLFINAHQSGSLEGIKHTIEENMLNIVLSVFISYNPEISNIIKSRSEAFKNETIYGFLSRQRISRNIMLLLNRCRDVLKCLHELIVLNTKAILLQSIEQTNTNIPLSIKIRMEELYNCICQLLSDISNFKQILKESEVSSDDFTHSDVSVFLNLLNVSNF